MNRALPPVQPTLAVGQVKIEARQLANLVKPTLHFCAADDMLPSLAAVHLVARDTWLVAEATDRYRMAVARHDLGGRAARPRTFECLLSAKDARHLLALFRVPARRVDDITLTLKTKADNTLTVTTTGGPEDFADAAWTYRLRPQPYPDIAKLMAGALKSVGVAPAAPVGLNGRYLGDWRHVVTDGHSPLRVYAPDPLKPVVVAYGEHFLGLQMPVRPPEGHEALRLADLDTWLPLLPVKADPVASEVPA